MKRYLFPVFVGLALWAAPAHAGGDFAPGGYYCAQPGGDRVPANLYRRDLKKEAWERYRHAAEVANAKATYHSLSPLFVWSNEAKISCAKAYGFLRKKRDWRRASYEMLQQCDCFYGRMLRYAGAAK